MQAPVLEKITASPLLAEEEADQLEFDFGPKFRDWIVPFVDQEPIQVLNCSKQVEKWLLDQNIATLGALRFTDLSTETYLRKLGQGQRDEITLKLKEYLHNKPIKKTTSVDFLSLLKSATAHIDKKKLWVCLKPYGLEGWLQLSPLEQAEEKKMTLHEKMAWVKEAEEQVRRDLFADAYKKMIEAWILPWIEKRGGMASAEELNEYLELRSLDATVAAKVLSFCPIDYELYLPVESGRIYSSLLEQSRHRNIRKVLKSYFPTSTFKYEWSVLVRLVLEELSKMDLCAAEAELKRAYEEVIK